jgi:hypothetical protein
MPWTPVPFWASLRPWTPAVLPPAPVWSTSPTIDRAPAVASVVRIVVAAPAVLTPPSTTAAALAGKGRTSACAAMAPVAAAAAVNSARRVRTRTGCGADSPSNIWRSGSLREGMVDPPAPRATRARRHRRRNLRTDGTARRCPRRPVAHVGNVDQTRPPAETRVRSRGTTTRRGRSFAIRGSRAGRWIAADAGLPNSSGWRKRPCSDLRLRRSTRNGFA